MGQTAGADQADSNTEDSNGISMYEAEDGTLYWTLSFYIPFSQLCTSFKIDASSGIRRLHSSCDMPAQLRRLDAEQSPATLKVRDAVEPLFNDIADRTRQGEVRDRLLVEGQRETIIFHLPQHIGWKTEGRRFRVAIPESDQRRPAEMRRFWYLHSDGALSWHASFAFRYRDQLNDELAAGRVTSLYFLSLLQKLAWPKECDTSGIDDISTDALLDVRIGRPGGAEQAQSPFWQQIEHWFDADRGMVTRVHADTAGRGFADFLPEVLCIEVPGLKLCETRSLFFIQDKQFFDLIQPKSPKGKLVPRRERILDDIFKEYPGRITGIPENREQVHLLDEQFWRRMLDDASFPPAPATDEGDAEQAGNPPDAQERLIYLFLAGFNQNIIDWANQEASEVLDSLDPIYPSSDEQLEEGFFIRYANPRSLITYVPRSRTLEVGNDHILTCPYAFLIHVLAMNNEYLTREKEKRAFEVIDWVNRSLADDEGLTSNTEEARAILTNVEQQINRLRIDSFEHFDRHRYFNPFRYDTERDVFNELEQLRGTSRLEYAYKEALSALEEQARDLERIRAAAERRDEREAEGKEQLRDRRLGALFGLIGLSGVGQLLFNIHDYLAAIFPPHASADAPPPLVPRDYLLMASQVVIMALILIGAAHYLLWPLIRRWLNKPRRRT